MLNDLFNSLKSPIWPFCFCLKQTAFPDSWDSFFMIAVTAFPDNWDSLFRTFVTADPSAWALLIFPHLAKTKTNYWNYLSLAKIPSFSVALSPAALTQNSKNTLKLNIPFLAKSYDGFSENSLLFGTDFGWYSLLKYPLKLSFKGDPSSTPQRGDTNGGELSKKLLYSLSL